MVLVLVGVPKQLIRATIRPQNSHPKLSPVEINFISSMSVCDSYKGGNYSIGLEVLIAVVMNSSVVWDTAP
jgi:hypothetical protein